MKVVVYEDVTPETVVQVRLEQVSEGEVEVCLVDVNGKVLPEGLILSLRMQADGLHLYRYEDVDDRFVAVDADERIVDDSARAGE